MGGERKSGKKRKKKPKKLPRVTVGEALRALGVDEWKVAEGLSALMADDAARSKSGATQSFLRVLQECQRHLDPSGEWRGSVEDLDEAVRLLHEVERPVREDEEEEIVN